MNTKKTAFRTGDTAVSEVTEVAEQSTETSTALVESQASEVSLNDALHITARFGSEVRYGSGTETPLRRIDWATGNNACFAANGKTPLESARGWHIDKPSEDEMFPDDFEFCDAMGMLCERGLAREVVVAHENQETKIVNKVSAWQLYTVSLFVVAQGLPSRAEMRDPAERWGIAFGWDSKKNRSVLRFRCFIKEFMDLGYNGLFTVSFSSYCTDKAIECLKAQEYVLRFVEKLRGKAGEVVAMPYYAYALPIQCSINTLTAGTANTKQVYYPIPAITKLSPRDPQAAIEYLARQAITTDQAFILEDNGRVEDMATWSVEETKRIITGIDANTSNGAAGAANDGDDVPF